MLDLTLVSFGSGNLLFGVLFAIGVSMIAHGVAAPAADWQALLAVGVVWFASVRALTGLLWHPPDRRRR